MRTFINSTYVTLDGVVENPHLWPSLPGGPADEHEEVQNALLAASDVVVMGRRTYDVFAPAWSSRGGDPFSDRINAMPKVVASTTLTKPTWNNTEVVPTDVVDRMRRLKAEGDGHVLQYGFGALTQLLADAGLIDELHLWVYPQFVQASTADLLFRPELNLMLELRDTQVLSNGIVILRYRTASD
jgi:dihydrofolate reductase